MENSNFTMDLGFAPESLFETDQLIFGDGPTSTHQNNDSFTNESGEDFMDFELAFNSESMASFLELEQIKEVKPAPQITRPSVIITKPKSHNTTPKPQDAPEPKPQPILTDIMTTCGIGNEILEDFYTLGDLNTSMASPSSIHSDMELEKNQELIDELEEFFIKVDGTPTIVDDKPESVVSPVPSPDKILSALTSGNVLENNNTLTMEDLNNAYTTSMMSEDGQNVIIIIAPPTPNTPADSFQEPISPNSQSPASPTTTNDSDYSYDTDPEWSPSTNSNTSFSTQLLSPPGQTKQRKKYARTRPPQPPTGPYPVEKKERKKAQNRTAAFRYREKKKSEQDLIDEELDLLSAKNGVLKDKLTEMETEFKYLKKLMTEAGLGRYAQTVHI